MNEYGPSSSEEKEKQKYWDKQSPLLEKMKQLGMEEYVKTIKNFENAFKPKNRNLCCIDERETAGTIHDAGCGILNQEYALSGEMIKKLKEAGVSGVWSHKGCGAASMAFEQLNNEEKKIFGNADTYAQDWAKKKANALGVPYLGHNEVHPNFHIARAIYYDDTGKFDPSQSEKLPPGFVISRAYLEPKYAKYILEIAISIALGNHGFGLKQFEASGLPLQIILIENSGNPIFSLNKLYAEAKEAAGKYGKIITIDGFTAPVFLE